MGCKLDLDTITAVAYQIRSSGKVIGFTHGCFDLFHIGHLEFLKQSKKTCDYLVVGVDSDKRVAKYKGTPRPIVPAEHRMEILMENKYVDFVFQIDGSMSMQNAFFNRLYSKVNPSIVTYGKVFMYRDNMEARSGLFENIDFKEISHQYDGVVSTTKIIDKIVSETL